MGVPLVYFESVRAGALLSSQDSIVFSSMSTMAGLRLLLVVMGCAVLIDARSPLGAGPCFTARANTKMMPGAYMPQCEPWGEFKAKQCHGSTGYCWCVNAGGKKIAGTAKASWEGEPNCRVKRESPMAGPCFIARADTQPLPGAYMPQCEAWGDFKVKQCHASTGYCWCVTADGKKIAGSAKAAWEGEPNC